jgi:hypothetical protein
MSEWKETLFDLPPDGELVETKIDNRDGCRNEATLRRRGRLWFTPGENSMYVYYTPTLWRPVPSAEQK